MWPRSSKLRTKSQKVKSNKAFSTVRRESKGPITPQERLQIQQVSKSEYELKRLPSQTLDTNSILCYPKNFNQIYQNVGWMVGWVVGWLDGWMVGWLDGWMVGWLDGWMTGGLNDWIS